MRCCFLVVLVFSGIVGGLGMAASDDLSTLAPGNSNNSFAILGPSVSSINAKLANKYTYVGFFKNPLSSFNRNRLQFAIDNFRHTPTQISAPDRQLSFKDPVFTQNSVSMDFTVIGSPLTQQERNSMIQKIRDDANAQRARADVESQRQRKARVQSAYRRDRTGLIVALLGR